MRQADGRMRSTYAGQPFRFSFKLTMTTLHLLCLTAFFSYAFACVGKKNPPNLGNVWQRMVGNGVSPNPYTGSGDHPVSNGEELSCNFDSGCCWSNANPPTDQLDWVAVSGPPEEKKMRSSFGTTEMPSGNFLGVATETGAVGNPQTAQFYSCPIVCADGPITMNLRHWKTKDVKMEVCEEDSPDGPTTNCQHLKQSSGAPESVTLPGGQNKRLVVIATGFTAARGSVALIDDIDVHFTPCGQQPTQPPKGECTKIACNFESGNPCSYNNAVGGGGSKSWEVVKAPYQNPLTGVPIAADGHYFAGSNLGPQDSAIMATDFNYPQNYVVKFFGYRATEGIDLLACCDSVANCPYSTTNQVQVSDFKNWKPATVTCPPGTKKVLFQAKNSGKNYGAAGLDNVQLLVPSGQNAC